MEEQDVLLEDSSDDRHMLTELMRAAKSKDPVAVVELLALGTKHTATLFQKDGKGRTALDWARMSNNPMAVSVLQKAMATAIYEARSKAVDATILSKPSAATVNARQTKELFDALRSRDTVEALRVLHENKLFRQEVNSFRDVFFIDCQDQFGFTPLILAAGMNFIDVVNKLIDLDVEIDHKNRFGHTALTWACSTGHSEIVRILLFNGANIHHRTNEGRTCLHYACLYTKSGVADVLLKFLLERFAIHQAKAQYKTFDKTRLTHYATLMEDFINARDKKLKQAEDLLQSTSYISHKQSSAKLVVDAKSSSKKAVSSKKSGRSEQIGSSSAVSAKYLSKETVDSPQGSQITPSIEVGDSIPKLVNDSADIISEFNAQPSLEFVGEQSISPDIGKDDNIAIVPIVVGDIDSVAVIDLNSPTGAEVDVDSFDILNAESISQVQHIDGQMLNGVPDANVGDSFASNGIGISQSFAGSDDVPLVALENSNDNVELPVATYVILSQDQFKDAQPTTAALPPSERRNSERQEETPVDSLPIGAKVMAGKSVHDKLLRASSGNAKANSYRRTSSSDISAAVESISDVTMSSAFDSDFESARNSNRSSFNEGRWDYAPTGIAANDQEISRVGPKASIEYQGIAAVPRQVDNSIPNNATSVPIGVGSEAPEYLPTHAGRSADYLRDLSSWNEFCRPCEVVKPKLINKKNRYHANNDALYLIESGQSMELVAEDSLALSPEASPEQKVESALESNKTSRRRSNRSNRSKDIQSENGVVDAEGNEILEGSRFNDEVDLPFYEDDGESIPSWDFGGSDNGGSAADGSVGSESNKDVDEDQPDSAGFETPSISVTPSASSSRVTSARENERQQLVSEKLSGLVHAIKHIIGSYGDNIIMDDDENMLAAAATMMVPMVNLQQLENADDSDIEAVDPRPHPPASPTTEIAEIRRLLRSAKDHICEWRGHGEREYTLSQPIACWLECGYKDTMDKIYKHISTDCPHKAMECTDCCTFIRQKDYKHHCLKVCAKRQIACPNSIHGCTSFVRFDERLVHTSLHCLFREVNCRLGCGMLIRCYKREDHEAVHCKHREIKCDQCQQTVRSYQITDHLHNKCPNRIVQCSVGCGASFLAAVIEDHEQYRCTMPCRWGCGQAIGPVGNRRHHETFACPSRPAACGNPGCTTTGLTARFSEEHRKMQCSFRLQVCTSGCGAHVARKDMDAHNDPWHGDCPERLVRCPSNLVGWRVRHRKDVSAGFGIILKYKRTSFVHNTLTRQYFDGEDLVFIRFETKQVWMNPWSEPLILVNKTMGKGIKDGACMADFFECGWIGCNKLNSHLSESCQLRSIWVQAVTDTVVADVRPADQLRLEESWREREDALDKTALGLWHPTADGEGGRNDDVVSWALTKQQRLKKRDKFYSSELSTPAASLLATYSHRSDRFADSSLESKVLDDGSMTNSLAVGSNGSPIHGFESVSLDEGSARDQSINIQVANSEADILFIDDDNSNADNFSLINGSNDSRVLEFDDQGIVMSASESVGGFEAKTHKTKNLPKVKPIETYRGQHATVSTVKEMIEIRGRLDDFLTKPEDKQICEGCGESVLVTNFDNHLKHECMERQVRCSFGCGITLSAFEMRKHLTDSCPKRVVVCSVCNDESLNLWAEEVEQHKIDSCLMRPYPCQLGCGIDGLVFSTEESHRVKDCERRIIRCMCGTVMEHRMYEVHKIADCSEVQTLCPQGCGLYIRKDLVDHHLEKTCKNKSYFFLKYVYCPLGCGKRKMKKDVLEHVSYQCEKRLVECPFSCGTNVQYCRLKLHLYFCPLRRVCCEPGMVTCETYVKRWFYSLEGENGLNVEEVMQDYEDDDDGLTISTGFPSVPVTNTGKTKMKSGVATVAGTVAGTVTLETSGILPDDSLSSLHEGDLAEPSGLLSIGPSVSFAEGSDATSAADPFMPMVMKRSEGGKKTLDAPPPKPKKSGVVVDSMLMDKEAYDQQKEVERLMAGHDDESVLTMVSKKVIVKSRRPKGGMIDGKLILPAVISRQGSIITLDNLRLARCKRHHATLLMAAVRYDDVHLAEFIISRTGGLDIDIENLAGDTALTLACRLGKLHFVEILVQSGADVNLETSTGRTPLIEAVRAPNSEEICLYLTQSGAMVSYKTIKHGHLAMKWARRMKRVDTMRVLDLGAIVQSEIVTIFNAISCGDQGKIVKLIGVGEPFDPNGESSLYSMMEEQVKQARIEDRAAKALSAQAEELSGRINVSLDEIEKAKVEVELARKDMDIVLVDTDRVSGDINDQFLVFDRAVRRLMASDIEELIRLKKVEECLRIAMFSFGVLFGFLKLEDWPTNAHDRDSCKNWWSQVICQFKSSHNIIRTFSMFSIDKLQGIHGAKLLNRIPSLYNDLRIALEYHHHDMLKLAGSKKLQTTKKPFFEEITPLGNEEDMETEEAELTKESSTSVRSTTGAAVAAPTTPIQIWEPPEVVRKAKIEELKRKKEEAMLAAIPDDGADDYDSDSEQAWGGHWEKGIWIPERRTKKKRLDENSLGSSSVVNSVTFSSQTGPADGESATAASTSSKLDSTRKRSGSISPQRRKSMKGRRRGTVQSLGEENRRGSDLTVLSEGSTGSSPTKSSALSILDSPFVEDVFVAAALGELDTSSIGGVLIEQIVLIIYCQLLASRNLHSKLTELDFQKNLVVEKGRVLTTATHNLQIAEKTKESLEKERAEIEKEYIHMLKLTKFTLERAKRYREKLRVWRLMNQVTASGHTAISWAASRGNFEAMDEILLHGGSIGFTAQLVNMSATYLQQSYRLYKLLTKQQDKAVMAEKDPNAAALMDDDVETGLSIVEKISIIKSARSRLLAKIVYQRRKIRLPIPEAAYAGKYEIIRRIWDRKSFHDNFSYSWCAASPPAPFTRKALQEFEKSRKNGAKVHMWDLLVQGERDLGSGRYDGDFGWIQRGDPRDFYGEARVELTELMRLIEDKKEKKRAERRRVRALTQEKKQRFIGQEGMWDAIKAGDFRKCMFLATSGGSSIDYECPDGRTALIAAAEENIVLPTHVYLLNDDGTPCLGVEYLLDRDMYRPAINLESHLTGWTALIRAAMLSRRHVLEALLDRGANVNHINRLGRTALHYAAQTGDIECTRILMERGINSEVKDEDGNTAFSIAEDMGFLNIMMKISQFRAGFMGDVRVTRGKVEDTIKCPLGCGKDVSPFDARFHVVECGYRVVECPQDCGIRLLQAREVEQHLATVCGRRVIICIDCKEEYNLQDEQHHRNHVCRTRLCLCLNGCGNTLKWCDMEKHQSVCTWRPTDCPQKCGQVMPFVMSYDHCRNECKRRRVICPQQCLAWIMFMNIEHHVKDTCPCRPFNCQFCNLTVPLRALRDHEDICELKAELCHAKCGAMVPSKHMKEHMKTTCIHRFVDCNLNCGLQIRVGDMNAHQSLECINRLVPCPLGCLQDDSAAIIHRVVCPFPAKEMPYHVAHDCPNRLITCPACVTSVAARSLAVHKSDECPERLQPCTNTGCLKQVAAKDFDHHIRFECRFRLQPCVQGCGQLVQVIRMGKHVISTCPMRHDECPLRCGMTLRYNAMVSHLDNECSRRFNKDIHRARQAYLQGLSYEDEDDTISVQSKISVKSSLSRATSSLELLTEALRAEQLMSPSPQVESNSPTRSSSRRDVFSPDKSNISRAGSSINRSATDRQDSRSPTNRARSGRQVVNFNSSTATSASSAISTASSAQSSSTTSNSRGDSSSPSRSKTGSRPSSQATATQPRTSASRGRNSVDRDTM